MTKVIDAQPVSGILNASEYPVIRVASPNDLYLAYAIVGSPNIAVLKADLSSGTITAPLLTLDLASDFSATTLNAYTLSFNAAKNALAITASFSDGAGDKGAGLYTIDLTSDALVDNPRTITDLDPYVSLDYLIPAKITDIDNIVWGFGSTTTSMGSDYLTPGYGIKASGIWGTDQQVTPDGTVNNFVSFRSFFDVDNFDGFAYPYTASSRVITYTDGSGLHVGAAHSNGDQFVLYNRVMHSCNGYLHTNGTPSYNNSTGLQASIRRVSVSDYKSGSGTWVLEFSGAMPGTSRSGSGSGIVNHIQPFYHPSTGKEYLLASVITNASPDLNVVVFLLDITDPTTPTFVDTILDEPKSGINRICSWYDKDKDKVYVIGLAAPTAINIWEISLSLESPELSGAVTAPAATVAGFIGDPPKELSGSVSAPVAVAGGGLFSAPYPVGAMTFGYSVNAAEIEQQGFSYRGEINGYKVDIVSISLTRSPSTSGSYTSLFSASIPPEQKSIIESNLEYNLTIHEKYSNSETILFQGLISRAGLSGDLYVVNAESTAVSRMPLLIRLNKVSYISGIGDRRRVRSQVNSSIVPGDTVLFDGLSLVARKVNFYIAEGYRVMEVG